MRFENGRRIRDLILELGEYYGEPINDARLEMFSKALADLEADDVKQAIRELIQDPKVVRMPLAAAIRARVQPGEDPESLAVDAANRIWEASARFGHIGQAALDARAFIGELGWKVVERQGGWNENFKLQCSLRDAIGLKAQWRELAKALYARAKAGTIDQAPALPEGPGNGRLKELTKAIGGMK